MNKLVNILSLFIFLLLSPLVIADSTNQLTSVKLQLKWQHQFQFAGYYAAIEKGFYGEVGLDVTLIEAKPGKNSIQAVLSGEAEFGVGTSELLLNYYRGDPVMVLGVIMQHSPLALAVLNTSGISNIHQLANYPMMIEPNSLELFAYFKSEGFNTKQLKLTKHTHLTQDLIEDRVKSMSIYTTDETYDFFSKDIKYQLFRPVMGGIDFYGDNLFTTKTLFNEKTELVKDFRKASLKGWQYAMQYPEEIIQLILSKYSKRKTAEHLRYEANKMSELMEPRMIEVGYSNPGRWKHIAQTYLNLGIISKVQDVGGMLYQPTVELAYQKLKTQFYYVSAAVLLLIILSIIYYRQYYIANIRRKQFETLYLNAPVCLIELDTKGIIKNWNREAEKTFQYSKGEAIGNNIYGLIVATNIPDSINTIMSSTWKANQITYSENLNVRKDGQDILCTWANMPFETEYKNQKRIICMSREVTKEKEMEQKLYHSAHYDELTQIPNRTLILTLLKEGISDARRNKTQLALLFIDLNDFKVINDTYGHLAGDEVLKQVAQRIKNGLRENDSVGRLSGDEFIVVIKNLENDMHLQTVIEKVNQIVKQNITFQNLSLNISSSIGFSLYPKDSEEIQQLITLADKSMYKIKQSRE